MIKKEPTTYLFTSARLGFRNWNHLDIDTMAAISADKEVMQFFPATKTKKETQLFIEKMQQQYTENGFCYFAVDLLETIEFIGFIGISKQEYDAGFGTSFIDIGWRLKKSTWNKGYATEGAKRCLKYAFKTLELRTIYAVAPTLNSNSMHVMKKIGMEKHLIFMHPLIADDNKLKECVVYKIEG